MSNPEEGSMAVALFDFPGVREDNLSFIKGEVITILEMSENGWWKGTSVGGKVGIFPYNYVISVKELQKKGFRILKAKKNSSPQNPEDLVYKVGTLITYIRPLSDDIAFGRVYNDDGNDIEERESERKVGSFIFSDFEETGEYDEKTAEEETKLAELEEERTKIEAQKKEKERNELEKETEYLERMVISPTLNKVDEERASLKRENEKLAKELEEMKRQLAEKRDEAKNAELALEAAAAEAARVNLAKEEQEKQEQRAKEVQEKANKSFVNTVDGDGFAAPMAPVAPKERQRFKVASRFAKLGKGSVLCKACEKSVAIGPLGKRAIGSAWHNDCFKCGTCDKVLRSEYLEHGGFPFCKNCHRAAFGIKGFGFGGAMSGQYKSKGP